MRSELIALLRCLHRALIRRLVGVSSAPVAHGELQHAHWDRARRAWLWHAPVPSQVGGHCPRPHRADA